MPRSLRARTTLVLAATLVPAALTTTSLAGTANATSAQAPVRLEATLSPSGDPNGRGEAILRLNRETNRVCAALEWSRIGTPNAAHIHRKSDGAVVIDLTNAVGDGTGCTANAGRRKIGNVLQNPRRYYVNVHNTTYPAGAIQGTVHR